MINVNTPHFHIFYKEADQGFAEKIIGQIEEFYSGVCRKACMEPGDEQYDLYVCGTPEDFILYTGKSKEEYRNWMVGNTDMEKKRLCVASPRVKGDFSERYQEYLIKVMLHETVHVIFNHLCRPDECDIWLSEGIAVCLAGQTAAGCVSEKNYPRINELGGRTDMSAFVEKNGYDYSGIYVWYLLERYGMEKFISVYRGEYPAAELLEDGFECRAVTAYNERRPHKMP